MNPALALQEGLYNLRKRGWCQGTHGSPRKGPVDLIGSLEPEYIGICRLYLKAAIHRMYGPRWNVTSWNDSRGRTYQEVEAVMLAAISDAEVKAA